jgi:quinol monooxygenase YgiN
MEEHDGHHENPILVDLPEGSFAFHYILQAKPGQAEAFKHAFEEWDHSDQNLMHSTPGIVHEGILYQSENDENRFYLIGIWNNRENHRTAVAKLRDMHPAWLDLLDTPLVPEYLQIIG